MGSTGGKRRKPGFGQKRRVRQEGSLRGKLSTPQFDPPLPSRSARQAEESFNMTSKFSELWYAKDHIPAAAQYNNQARRGD
jgi:hypothetical protein